MIFTRLQAHHFRSFEQVDQRLGRFQALVGPNASGKTTFFDAFDLLKDLMRCRGDVREAVSLRGAEFSKLLWMGRGESFELALEAKIPTDLHKRMGPTRQNFEAHPGFRGGVSSIGKLGLIRCPNTPHRLKQAVL